MQEKLGALQGTGDHRQVVMQTEDARGMGTRFCGVSSGAGDGPGK